jgi:uncharacterized protein (DUF58 family)
MGDMLLTEIKDHIFNKRPPTRLPLTLRRPRCRIRPTRFGYVFILLLLAMYLGSINYGNNLGFLLTFLLGSMMLVSIGQSYKQIAGITILSCHTRPIFAGRQASFEFTVRGGSKSHKWIGFEFNQDQQTLYDIPAGHTKRVAVKAAAPSRGMLRPGPLTLFTDYPLGLFRVQVKLDLNLECIVYPQPIFAELNTNVEKSTNSFEGDVRGYGVDDFRGLKVYAAGDPQQRISWRASSRGQGLFVKDFEGQYGSSVYLDWQAFKEPDLERKLSMLCHMVLSAHQNSLTFGLKLPAKTIAPQRGDIHRHRCLKALAFFGSSNG